MSKITDVRCVDGGAVNWSTVWRILKNMGWTVDRGGHRCPACSKVWRTRLDREARHGA